MKKVFKFIGLVAVVGLLVGMLSIAVNSGKEDYTNAQVSSNEVEYTLDIQVLDGEELMSSRSMRVPSGSTVYDAIKDNEDYVIDDGMVTSIMGVEQNINTSEYWMIYQNGDYAPVGIYDLTIEEDTSIAFKLEIPEW